jgi:hypothetical protein
MSQPRPQGSPYTLPTAVQLVPNGGYAQETTLQKSNTAAAYVINQGSDASPVVQGSVSFQGPVSLQAGADISGAVSFQAAVSFASAPVVPAGALVGTVTVTTLANTTSLSLLTGFPATCSGFYSVSFVCSTPGQQWNVSGVGRLVQTAGVVSTVDGFSGCAVDSTLLGASPTQTVAFCEIAANSSGSLSLYNATGVALSGTVNIYKIASSN